MATPSVRWRRVAGAPPYKVSSDGEVWSDLSQKLLRPGLSSTGYLTVALRVNGRKVSCCVHRLVAEAFIPNPYGKRTVNHKRAPRTDNRKVNLEWATYSENHAHSYKHLGRKAAASRAVVNGEGQRFESATAAARAFDRTPGAIHHAVRKGAVSAGTFWWLA